MYYSFTVENNIGLEARYSIVRDASFNTNLSTSYAPSIITMTSYYNLEVAYRTWTVTDTLTGQTIKFEDGVNGANDSTSVRLDYGVGVNITQTIAYTDGVRTSKTQNVVVNQQKMTTFKWKYHEDYRGAWWNPFDKDDLDPKSMNRDASIVMTMNFSWYYSYASDPIVRGYQPSYLTKYVNCGDPVIKNIAQEFKKRTAGWSDIDRANYVLHFVQSIPYKYDKEGDALNEHWNYPAETLWRNQGDCEDHAILYAALMKELGYNVALLDVRTTGGGHLAVGLDVKGGSGAQIIYQNTIFFYCEATPSLTGSNWDNVGYMPSGYVVTAVYLM
jgi:transglutaminase-like putative cysteine protease